MELKKTPKADLVNKRNIFIQIGLVIALGTVFAAFNINNHVQPATSLGDLTMNTPEDIVLPPTVTEPAKPMILPPPPMQLEFLNIVDNLKPGDLELALGSEFFDPKGDYPTLPPSSDAKKDIEKANDFFWAVEIMPEFPGGMTALATFLSKTIKYPQDALENGDKGKVFIRFIVETDGSVSNVEIARGVSPSLNNEALRVVKLLPQWKPGIQSGKKVRVAYTIPINFQL